jgi:hypothetical protein
MYKAKSESENLQEQVPTRPENSIPV